MNLSQLIIFGVWYCVTGTTVMLISMAYWLDLKRRFPDAVMATMLFLMWPLFLFLIIKALLSFIRENNVEDISAEQSVQAGTE
jgi:hypothetical protein